MIIGKSANIDSLLLASQKRTAEQKRRPPTIYIVGIIGKNVDQ